MAGGGDGAADDAPSDADLGDDAIALLSMAGRLTDRLGTASPTWRSRRPMPGPSFPCPSSPRCHGPALGGGLQIALGADIRIVAPDAKLSVLEIRWGLLPDMTGLQMLPRLVGIDVAKELSFTGRMVSGEEAVALGLATRTSADPRADALALATEIAGKNPARHPRHQGPAQRRRHPAAGRVVPRGVAAHAGAHRQPEPGRGRDGLLREARPGLHRLSILEARTWRAQVHRQGAATHVESRRAGRGVSPAATRRGLRAPRGAPPAGRS